MSLWPGYRIGPYRIEAEIGAGAQATVYRAHDAGRGRDVAVKVLSVDLAHDPTLRARFEREARLVAGLDHPAVVAVHDTGEVAGRPYICMELVDGGTLQARLAEGGAVAPQEAAAVLRRVASALDHAHGAGLVHRDVKPGNILIDRSGDAWLSDFGLARVAADAERLTRTGMWVGTLEYMAPEQIRAQRVGPAADLYALAAVAYEALTGRPPFVRGNAADLMRAHLADAPRPASALRPELAAADAVLARGLAKEPAQRFGTAAAFVHALAGALGA
ncbi:MAG: serine/threonine protein kinase [Thermoleophilia bacterium]|nr:serine/threonine protein kinase [Thermoleophilia bacterium]